MKNYKRLVALCCVFFIATSCPFLSDARVKVNQEQVDSAIVRLAKRLESGAWKFTATKFTGTNDVCADCLDERSNIVVVGNGFVVISLDFIGARVSAQGTTPHQLGRAVAGAAAAVRFNGMLPNYVKAKGQIEEMSASIGRKSKSITVKFSYFVEDTNLDMLSSSSSVEMYVNTSDLSAHMVFKKMNLDGTLDGYVTLL